MQATKHDATNAATTSLGGQDLARERQRASFDVRQLTYLLYGGEKNTKKLERIAKICEEDPVFNKQDRVNTHNPFWFICLFDSVHPTRACHGRAFNTIA